MELYAAIDVRGGRCVRLVQGDFERETVYREDPVAVAKELEQGGAHWVHVVDLDGARSGQPANADLVTAIVEAVDVPVQFGGGIRDEDTAATLLDAGVRRIVVGTAAFERPGLVAALAAAHPGRLAVGLDVRGREVAVRGWTEASGVELLEAVAVAGSWAVDALVVTQIVRDGTLAGPDLAGLATVLDATGVPVVASGGVGSLADLHALASLDAGGRRLAGVIVGRALYEGAFSVEEAVAACAASG